MKHVFISFVLGLASFSGYAENVRYYDVEIIIYENLNIRERESESWPESIEQDRSENVIAIGSPYPGPVPKEYIPALTFKPLPQDEYKLKEPATKIEESDSRRMLLHTAWRQPGMSKDKALSVHLSRLINAQPQIESEEQTEMKNFGPYSPPEAGQLNGYIKIILSRYLRVEADIAFTTQAKLETPYEDFSVDAEITTKPRVYRLHQTRRRIRSLELHYLDHPVLGMLLLITPYEMAGKG